MKNSILIMFTITLLLSSCDTNTSEKTIGFVTGDNAELQWHLGTQKAIDVVTTVDELWANQDYEAMRPFFADSVKVWRPNGAYTDTFDSFIESLNYKLRNNFHLLSTLLLISVISLFFKSISVIASIPKYSISLEIKYSKIFLTTIKSSLLSTSRYISGL